MEREEGGVGKGRTRCLKCGTLHATNAPRCPNPLCMLTRDERKAMRQALAVPFPPVASAPVVEPCDMDPGRFAPLPSLQDMTFASSPSSGMFPAFVGTSATSKGRRHTVCGALSQPGSDDSTGSGPPSASSLHIKRCRKNSIGMAQPTMEICKTLHDMKTELMAAIKSLEERMDALEEKHLKDINQKLSELKV